MSVPLPILHDDFDPGDSAAGLSVNSITGRNLLRLVEFADRHDLPTARIIEQSIAVPRRKRLRWHRLLNQLKDSGDHGFDRQLVVAWLSRREAIAIGVAEATGTVPAVCEAMMRTPPASSLERWRSDGGVRQMLRSLMGLFYLAASLGFLNLMIFPTIEKMCEELGLPIPMPWFFDNAGGMGGLIFLTAFAMLAGVIILSLWRVVRMGRRFDVADTLSLVSINLRAGRPVAATIEALVATLPGSLLRRSTVRAAEAIRGGSDPWSAMADARLIGPHLRTAVALAPDPAATSWLLATEAAEQRYRCNAAAMRAWRLASWLMFAAMAAATLLICVGVFTVLASLISMFS